MCIKCVHGGPHGDFNWPYNVPDGPFGPWSPMCQNEILNPQAPCIPIPGKPVNFTQMYKLLSDCLQAIVTLCPGFPIEPGDPRKEYVENFLEFNWLRHYEVYNDDLKNGVYHHVYVIIKESLLRGTFVYFEKLPVLTEALQLVYDNLKEDGWKVTEERVNTIVSLIFQHGTKIDTLNFDLGLLVISALDNSWVDFNNGELLTQKDFSLTVAEEISQKNLSLTETLRRYCGTDGVLRFDIKTKTCGGKLDVKLHYGNSKFTVRNNKDFLTVCKAVFTA